MKNVSLMGLPNVAEKMLCMITVMAGYIRISAEKEGLAMHLYEIFIWSFE